MANINQNKKVHFLYKSINQLNGNYYVGIHSTNKVDDSYIGSGTRFRNEVRKYGKSNFTREILEFFNTRGEALLAEFILVSSILQDPNCLNLCKGGRAGGLNDEARKKSKEKRDWLRENNPEWNTEISTKVSEGLKKSYQNRPGTFTGKTHKPETIEKMKTVAQGRGKREDNSQYGTCWITNEIKNKKIKKSDPIPDGWRLGRKVLKTTVA
jgi:hypothetical protein